MKIAKLNKLHKEKKDLRVGHQGSLRFLMQAMLVQSF
jgi:hypothetical protein